MKYQYVISDFPKEPPPLKRKTAATAGTHRDGIGLLIDGDDTAEESRGASYSEVREWLSRRRGITNPWKTVSFVRGVCEREIGRGVSSCILVEAARSLDIAVDPECIRIGVVRT